MSAPKAAIGFVHPLMVTAMFMRSVMYTRERLDNCPVFTVMSGPNVAAARNLVVRCFLDRCDADYLFMVDTDMMFAFNAVERLMAHGEPIVSGFCLTSGEHPVPSMYRQIADEGAMFESINKWPTDAFIDVDGVGSACTLIHREVFQKIEQERPNKAAQWYQEVQSGDELVGEDLEFCLRARACGYRIKVDTSVQIAHIKGILIGAIT